MARDHQGAIPERAKGQDAGTERKRDPNTCAVLSCVRAGKEVPQGEAYLERGGGKSNTHRHSLRANSTEQEGGRGTGRSKRSRRGDTGGEEKKTATPGGGARRKSPQQVKKEAQHPKEEKKEK